VLVAERLRARLAAIPDLERRLTRPVLFSFRTPIEVEVHGEELVALRRQAAVVESALAALPELADVAATLRAGAPEVEIVYDRERLARSGLALGAVADAVRDLVRGSEATRFNLRDRRIPIVVQLDEETAARSRTCAIWWSTPGGSARSRSRRSPTCAWARGRARCAASTAGAWRWCAPTSRPAPPSAAR
jgi:hydrophobic/amphiphilic exporter-1 (mainly G- bacteria), HAE1 family